MARGRSALDSEASAPCHHNTLNGEASRCDSITSYTHPVRTKMEGRCTTPVHKWWQLLFWIYLPPEVAVLLPSISSFDTFGLVPAHAAFHHSCLPPLSVTPALYVSLSHGFRDILLPQRASYSPPDCLHSCLLVGVPSCVPFTVAPRASFPLH